MNPLRRSRLLLSLLLVASVACGRHKETSRREAVAALTKLKEATVLDVAEVTRGMPEGAKVLSSLYTRKVLPRDDLTGTRESMDAARSRVQDLRVAKSTFFLFAESDGAIVRSDREPDVLSGKNVFAPFPELKGVLAGTSVTTRGNLPEAAARRGLIDAEWVHAVPVNDTEKVRGLYVSGWSWAGYAYRLENALRSDVRAVATANSSKEPLVYVYVAVDKQVYGAPISPRVTADEIAKLDPVGKTANQAVFSTIVEITGRDFGLAATRAPALGNGVAIVVIRSET